MAPEDMRIAIAIALKITPVPMEHDRTRWGSAGYRFLGSWLTDAEPAPIYHGIIPRYTEDHNAMYEAEEHIIGTDKWDVYVEHLRQITRNFNTHASAKQKAEAFMKALNLWRD